MMVSFGTFSQTKFGFVDSQKLMDTMPSRIVALEKLQAHEKQLINDLKTLQADIQKLEEDYQKNLPNMSLVVRQAAEKKLQEKHNQFQTSQQSSQEELQAYGEELNNPILDRIEKAIAIVAERQKLTMVVDKSSTLFHAADMDITKLVAVELMKLEKEVKN